MTFSVWRAVRFLGPGAVLAVGVACGGNEPEQLEVEPEGNRLDGREPDELLNSGFCENPRPGATPLRRLSNLEYENTLLALGVDAELVSELVRLLPSEPVSLGFRNSASSLTVNSLLAQKYRQIASKASGEFWASCGLKETGCVESYIRDLGLLMYRRPLSDEEYGEYRALYDEARAEEEEDESMRWVIQTMLQSPHFLYKVEVLEREVRPVVGYEMANRLSYTFWNAPPDEDLLRAAAEGRLQTQEQVLEQALRLLQDDRAYRIYDFFEQWLDLDELTRIERDPNLYPDLNRQLPELLRAESRAFVQDLLSRSESTFSDLLAAPYTFVNGALAEHYGISGVDGEEFTWVEAPERSGVLTQGMLAVQDAATHTSIVRRGLKIRTDFLCQIVPAPPDTVDLSLEGIGPELSQPERLEIHRNQPTCNPCHQMMDPIGLAFEHIDAVGRVRSVDEYGHAVQTAGEISGTRDADGPVASAAEVAHALANSEEAEQCYLIQNFRYFLGRDVQNDDLCSQAQLTQIFRDSEQSLVSVLVGIAMSDAFLYKAALPAEGE